MDDRATGRFLTWLLLLVMTLAGLGLRLLAWHWHEFYPLGGDEREYLDQALALLRGEGYHELKLMRPPLYAVFLAAGAWLVDGSTQGLRLIQALVSTATIPLTYLWSAALLQQGGCRRWRRPALAAALLAALSYTLALNATELLTETAFLFGLTLVFWLLMLAAHHRSLLLALATGLALGALCLLRSVALPLLVLAAGWLWLSRERRREDDLSAAPPVARRDRRLALLFVLGVLGSILPWTARNVATYDRFILIDTTGQENLWLDNDPRGRETVKRQLYAMGEDRGARAALSVRMGLRSIGDHPGHFAKKVWREVRSFFALEQADDMRRRPAIWVRPGEVWLRLLLGDALWLLILVAGLLGLVLGPWRGMQPVLGLWVVYIVLTGALFHVELRYRLPLYPVLLPAAGWVVGGRPQPPRVKRGVLAWLAAAGVVALALALMLLHSNYPALAWQLGLKHLQLARADAAIARGELERARSAAASALRLDEGSALTRVALARIALHEGNVAIAERWLREATAAVSGHPYAHLLLGDLLRRSGDEAAARRELAYETASLEDLQQWAWDRFSTPPPARIDIGAGLDLGWISGFHAAKGQARWTTDHAKLQLGAPAGARTLSIRLRAPRPAGAPRARATILVNGAEQLTTTVGAEWQELTVPLPPQAAGGILLVEIRSNTIRPHDYQRTSPDARLLGVEVAEVRVSSER